ncbi:MAG: MgtC/SapB family protein [Actinomycetota bacterium]|nr:MgtC/SapB family protein [Actinomycetota bacterium]MDD5665819.1 MgtC/SapB family protein [Actinomycetota bacterium]
MSESELALRLLVAVACGGLIGLERERGDRPAGFRTYIMVTLGAALFTALSLVAFPGADSARVAAQVVVGIGFLGVGVIVSYGGTHVVGITTAATMWASAAVGMAAGAGYFLTCVYGTAIILAVLIALPLVENRIIARFRSRRMYFNIRSSPRTGLVEEVETTLAQFGITSTLLRFYQCKAEEQECSLLLRVNISAKTDLLEVMDTLYQVYGVKSVSFEE